jgi:inositol phosphorylceramide mannosyltransferase catalytic subunit
VSEIPPTIFQTWKSKTDLPKVFRFWSESLKTKNSGYDYILWDDADNRAFIAQHYPWFLETYDDFPAEIYRVDAVRYFFLYHFGGIYADFDMQCLKPLDSLRARGGIILGQMGTDASFEHAIPNACMMSEAREEFWLLVISLMQSAEKRLRPEYVTGSVVLKQAYDRYAEARADDDVQDKIAEVRNRLSAELAPKPVASSVTLVPAYVFYPIDWHDPIHDTYLRRPLLRDGLVIDDATANSMFPKSYLMTLWSHSWEPQDLGNGRSSSDF